MMVAGGGIDVAEKTTAPAVDGIGFAWPRAIWISLRGDRITITWGGSSPVPLCARPGFVTGGVKHNQDHNSYPPETAEFPDQLLTNPPVHEANLSRKPTGFDRFDHAKDASN